MTENKALVRRVGVINWDCGLPPTTFFGSYISKSLGPREFRDRTPYYAIQTAPDAIEVPDRTQADFDAELRHAIAAGIDYFAYCWYDDRELTEHVVEGSATAADGHVQELNKARKLHLTSALRNQIGLCAILLTSHPYTDDEFRDLAAAMAEPCYEKLGGRPLVFVFGQKWPAPVARLKAICRERGVAEPYVALVERWETPPEELALADALSDYSGCLTGATWEALVEDMKAGNEYRIAQGRPIIPHFSMGWDPSPRVKHPVPWCGYPALDYAKAATPEQLLAGAREFRKWLADHAEHCPTGHLVVFAWNEFEEGGWICPTWTPDGAPDTTRCQTFAKMVKLWKEEEISS